MNHLMDGRSALNWLKKDEEQDGKGRQFSGNAECVTLEVLYLLTGAVSKLKNSALVIFDYKVDGLLA